VTSPQKRKGSAAELAVAKWLRKLGWIHAERSRAGWQDDRGDIDGMPGVCIEVKAEKKIEEVRELKREKLENCKFKVTGMTLTEEGIMLDGLPFKSNQVNTARRIIAGLELQYAMMGDIKIASFDASLLDQHSRDLVVKWADERGIELFIEEGARTGEGLEIIITE